ncbi:MAG: hypothetical protein AB1600_04245 [Bacteroidota bacterium]
MGAKKLSIRETLLLVLKRKKPLAFTRKKMTWKEKMVPILTAAILVSVCVIYLHFLVKAKLGPTPSDIVKGDPAIESQVVEIASNFVCICGKCNRISVEDCRCSLAARERDFIRQKIKKGEKPEVIIAAVDALFGGKK